MPAIDNYSHRKYGDISILDIASSSPRKYQVRCERCKSEWTESHTTLRNKIVANALTCKNDNCRLPIADQQQREKDYFKKLRQRERDEQNAAEERRLREKYGQKPEPTPAPKPSLEELDAEFQRTASQLARVEKERIIKGLPDPEFFPDPKYDNAKLPANEVDTWNNAQAEIFMAENPSWYQTPENAQTLLDFIWAQGVRIISAETYQRAFDRLKQFNLLEERPQEPIATPVEPDPVPLPSSHEGYYQPTPKPQPRYDGIDLETGESRSYSDYELSRMPAETMRKSLRIPRVNRLGEYIP